jgi:hypothetical protein
MKSYGGCVHLWVRSPSGSARLRGLSALADLWRAGLAGECGAVWLYGENLTVHFAEEPLAHYNVVYKRDQKGLKAVTNLRLFETQFRSPQLLLWDLGPGDWHVVLRLPSTRPDGDRRPQQFSDPCYPGRPPY